MRTRAGMKLEREVGRDVARIFEEKRRRIGVDARLDLGFLDHAPVVGKNVYGEAFPLERPPRVRIEVFAPDATTKEMKEIVCEELLHVRHPELSEEEIRGMVPACAGGSQNEAERKPFYIVCARCGNPYRVRLAEKEWIKGECPWCGNPIHVMRHENRLFERVDGKWEPMATKPIWTAAA